VALDLFSRQGYRGTTLRDIAEGCERSTGIVYHHFADKEEIFTTLLGHYWEALESPDHPINRALARGAFPDNLEDLGRAARQSVIQYRPYILLIYVDVVEMGGEHIRKFYSEMSERFDRFAREHEPTLKARARLRPEVSPGFALMLSTRIFLHYFAVEILFGVPDHFGQSEGADRRGERGVHEIAEILRHGMLPTPLDGAPDDAPSDP
jgi:AcrR family transcriptional regulator